MEGRYPRQRIVCSNLKCQHFIVFFNFRCTNLIEKESKYSFISYVLVSERINSSFILSLRLWIQNLKKIFFYCQINKSNKLTTSINSVFYMKPSCLLISSIFVKCLRRGLFRFIATLLFPTSTILLRCCIVDDFVRSNLNCSCDKKSCFSTPFMSPSRVCSYCTSSGFPFICWPRMKRFASSVEKKTETIGNYKTLFKQLKKEMLHIQEKKAFSWMNSSKSL